MAYMAVRKATAEEMLVAWRTIAFELNMHRHIAMNHAGVVACLDRIDKWVNAHSTGNGERTDREIALSVNEAFWKHIARTEPQPLPPRKKKTKAEREEEDKDEDDSAQ